MCYTYVLRSLRDKALYIGSTNDISRRITQHNNGYCISTKNRRPLKLVFKEKHRSISEARIREKSFKKSHSLLYRAAGWRDDHK